ncbi:hypothetical protein BDN70DRAFT_995810 [Pholiota conissans]|uniref:CFEM domain-containing protein n=1 Tax=Pholiota conissans TaxID=109636 RepID=A0A9P5YUX5_9AGAR|nr:hypothetical protein BDN70DRAFT_995810 [Pholiota conissans]
MFFRLSLALTLAFGLAGHVSAQDNGQVTLDDLPDCAVPCAKNAAAQVSCATTDLSCLCSHSEFSSSTQTCANQPGVCGVEDRSSVSGILGEICAPPNTSSTVSSSTSTTSSAAAASTTSSAKPTSTSATTSAAPTTTSHTETTSAQPAKTTPDATTPVAGGAGTTAAGALTTPAPTTGSSSTLVVVQTVELPQTSDLTSAAMRMEGGVGPWLYIIVALHAFGVVQLVSHGPSFYPLSSSFSLAKSFIHRERVDDTKTTPTPTPFHFKSH